MCHCPRILASLSNRTRGQLVADNQGNLQFGAGVSGRS